MSWITSYKCCFNKNGSQFLTGSYDQTCIIWDTILGEKLQQLKGHSNVVYSVSFNLPYGDRVATCSFDTTEKFGMSEMANCYQLIVSILQKLSVCPLIILVKDFVQVQWTAQQLFGI